MWLLMMMEYEIDINVIDGKGNYITFTIFLLIIFCNLKIFPRLNNYL
ncbi:hypothetical protein XNC1_1581 [Xenorhabdus nematophila ATCC 19061]|uniref:Uncharacterized protein n=1 Tax=Xenorhabdus nematophila (strain ATCC 19061 / DSM 3370 / CCUG 14189 / LMG 1036 / NCIMB 9965 / AN6) TaxID=406817 RepID=D3VBK5_XENNA|nr:hypothetical protein XNC1_1581 [Xenorhabdus nematophila ATCC 19061]CEF33363.1 hypothetical protein XNW1_4730026 [Xenorhabdus nematophila str. Websteri]CEF33515.1 hypothetical protein XNW1_480027 [Xenorhabdus nematophila str. Websteri]CEK22531.1 hypothetical protein XNC2_1537 [Xenorhabdus nematophila AN6/1]